MNGILVLVFCLLLFVSAFVTGLDMLFHLAYMLLGLNVITFLWTWYDIRHFAVVRRTKTQHTQVGKFAEENLTLRNTGRLPKLWIEVHDQSTLPHHLVGRAITSLGGYGTFGWYVKTLCRKRGVYTLGPITVLSGDPFGLWRLKRALPAHSDLLVYPATVDLPGFVLPAGDLPGGSDLRRRTHYVTTNAAGVRDYYPGDSFNRIHWRSTARTGRLVSKEFELDPRADIWIVLDMERAVQARLLDADAKTSTSDSTSFSQLFDLGEVQIEPDTEEYGVVIAASIAKHLLGNKRSVGLIAYGDRDVIIPPDRGERQLLKIIEALALIRARGRTHLAEVLAAEELRFGRNTTVVVITPSDDEAWVTGLRYLLQRGVKAATVLLEGQSFGGETQAGPAAAVLIANHVPAYLVRQGDALAQALSYGRPARAF
jgi:uncharacterized protein (DUF58 family)